MTNDESIQNQELKLLYEKYIANEISEAEFHRLYDALLLPDKEAYLKELMTGQWHATSAIPGFDVDAIPLPELDTGRVIDMPARTPLKRITRIAAAAAILLLSGSALYYWATRAARDDQGNKPLISETIMDDALPGGDKAVLTLTDGKTIELDNMSKGTVATQGAIQVQNSNGQLSYASGDVPATETASNTLSTPKGGQYKLVLQDGSKVWLNALSSITYPVGFSGNARKVSVTGEVYFEVAKNDEKKFIVETGDITTEVLGTHFNINAYTDEFNKQVTLLEGSVKVSTSSGATAILKPGQAASTDKYGLGLSINKEIDVAEITAWKDGLFSFYDADVQTVMRQVSRWYDVDVVYEGKIPVNRFAGQIQRNSNLSQLLQILETKDVHFKIEGKRISVSK